MNTQSQRTYRGDVRAVYSGDDLVVLVDLGHDDLWQQRRVRLSGVDTPYARHAKPSSVAGQVRDYVRRLTRDRPVQIEVIRDRGKDWLAVIYIETRDGLHNLNDDLIRQGFTYTRTRTPDGRHADHQ